MPDRASERGASPTDGPLVSVVLPTYERPDLLADAVRSVLDQTHEPLELVVVDDGSSVDPGVGLEAVARELVPAGADGAGRGRDGGQGGDGEPVRDALTHDRTPLIDVRVARHDENRGANAARNTGVDLASGEFVAFLDDDDYWRPEKVERQVRAIERARAIGTDGGTEQADDTDDATEQADDTDDATEQVADSTDAREVAVCFVGREDVDAAGEVVRVEYPTSGGDFAAQLAEGAHFGTFSTVLVHASAFERTGPLDERMPCWQDREWYFRLAEHYDYVAVRERLTVRRIAELAQLSDDYEAQREVAYPRLLEKHAPTVAALGPGYERRFRAELSRGVGGAALSDGRYREAIRFLLRSLRYDPLRPKTLGYLLVALGGPWAHRIARESRRRLHDRSGRSAGSDSVLTTQDRRLPADDD